MRLIIEKSHGTIYASIEREKHHAAVEKNGRGVQKLDPRILENNCDLSSMPEGYLVFRLKKQ